MKYKVEFSEQELRALKEIASIRCGNAGITCDVCPLNLNTIPATRTASSGCFRNYASDILKANTQKEE